MRKRRIAEPSGLVSLVVLVWMIALPASASAAAGVLRVYTWSEYMDPTVVAEFEKRTGARIEFSYFESDEERDRELSASAGRGHDLVLVNGLQMEKYAKRGWLRPIAPQKAPNVRHLDPRWATAFPGAAEFGVVYFWGTMGIAYRSDLLSDAPTHWRDLLQPVDALRGKLIMPSSTRELLSFALKANGQSVNETDRSQLNAAAKLLLAQKPHVQLYGYPTLTEDSAMVSGRVLAAPMYSGDVLMVQQFAPGLKFVLPPEGGLLWVDYLTVASGSANSELAHKLIDFLNEPAIAARQAEYVYYATPNLAARAFLDQAFLDDPAVYPPASVLERSEFIHALPPRSQRAVNLLGVKLLLD